MLRSLAAAALSTLLAAAAPPPDHGRASFASLEPVAVFHLGKTADWVLATDDAIWVGSTAPFAVHRIDPRSNRVVASVALPGEPCAGLAALSGSLWVPLCGKPNSLARIDMTTNRLNAVLPIGPAAAEGGIAADGENLWMVTDAKGTLRRIDPGAGEVRQTVTVHAGAYNPLYSEGVVWVTGHDTGDVTAVEASTGKILAIVPVGEGPRFLTAGAGSIWILLQGSGDIVRVDARTKTVTARIAAGLAGKGGDITFGGGEVWPTLSGVPLSKIDAATNQIQQQWSGPGGDSLAWGFGAIWITDYKAGTVARYPSKTLGAR